MSLPNNTAFQGQDLIPLPLCGDMPLFVIARSVSEIPRFTRNRLRNPKLFFFKLKSSMQSLDSILNFILGDDTGYSYLRSCD